MGRYFYIITFWIIYFNNVSCQNGVGLRFATDYNWFFRANDFPLIKGQFSNTVFGIFYKGYNQYGGGEGGINFCYKPRPGQSNLPLVAQDFPRASQRTALTSLEAIFRVGPRVLSYFFPRFGLIVGYRFRQEGFILIENNQQTMPILNKWYSAVPVGIGSELPTGFGAVGMAIYYNVGLSNVFNLRQDPTQREGGRMRSWNFELSVTVGKPDENIVPPLR
jgi:hypothetical protein